MQPATCCSNGNASANLQVNPGKQLEIHILFETTRHLGFDDLVKIYCSFSGNQVVLAELCKLRRIH